MCCLKNEEETYEFLNTRMPKLGAAATTVDGRTGKVIELNVLRQRVRVLFEEDDSKEIENFSVDELTFTPRKRREEGQQGSLESGQRKPDSRSDSAQGRGESPADSVRVRNESRADDVRRKPEDAQRETERLAESLTGAVTLTPAPDSEAGMQQQERTEKSEADAQMETAVRTDRMQRPNRQRRPERGENEGRMRRPERGEGVQSRPSRPERGEDVQGRMRRPERGEDVQGRPSRPERGENGQRRPSRPERGGGVQGRPRRPDRGEDVQGRTRRPDRGEDVQDRPRRPERGEEAQNRQRRGYKYKGDSQNRFRRERQPESDRSVEKPVSPGGTPDAGAGAVRERADTMEVRPVPGGENLMAADGEATQKRSNEMAIYGRR